MIKEIYIHKFAGWTEMTDFFKCALFFVYSSHLVFRLLLLRLNFSSWFSPLKEAFVDVAQSMDAALHGGCFRLVAALVEAEDVQGSDTDDLHGWVFVVLVCWLSTPLSLEEEEDVEDIETLDSPRGRLLFVVLGERTVERRGRSVLELEEVIDAWESVLETVFDDCVRVHVVDLGALLGGDDEDTVWAWGEGGTIDQDCRWTSSPKYLTLNALVAFFRWWLFFVWLAEEGAVGWDTDGMFEDDTEVDDDEKDDDDEDKEDAEHVVFMLGHP